jgi:hypothetical protein
MTYEKSTDMQSKNGYPFIPFITTPFRSSCCCTKQPAGYGSYRTDDGYTGKSEQWRV